MKDGENVITYRKIIPLPAPQEEIVDYRIWKIKGQWKLVDPPLPRVSVSSPFEFMHHNIRDEEEVLVKSPERDDLRRNMESYKEQLKVLESLLPLSNQVPN